MSTTVKPESVSFLSLATPATLLLAAMLGLAWQTDLFTPAPADALLFVPETVTIEARTFKYRADGEYSKGGSIIDPPMVEATETRPLTIMKYQVAMSDFVGCVHDGACRMPEAIVTPEADVPVTGVSYDDAQAYAAWLSRRTGQVWSLPTDRQLAFAAGKDFPDDALGLDSDNKNPALRWLADYKREAVERKLADPTPRVAGSFGVNEFGVADFAGNIWEWTTTCDRKVRLNDIGTIVSEDHGCGVYVTVGRHRSPMTYFVRDPKGGGCAVGTPPSNLGFRLVRDDRWYAMIARKFLPNL
jgi:formylglycine-generating enzyme required for sulfatase activity